MTLGSLAPDWLYLVSIEPNSNWISRLNVYYITASQYTASYTYSQTTEPLAYICIGSLVFLKLCLDPSLHISSSVSNEFSSTITVKAFLSIKFILWRVSMQISAPIVYSNYSYFLAFSRLNFFVSGGIVISIITSALINTPLKHSGVVWTNF